jgi:hypothetical protein
MENAEFTELNNRFDRRCERLIKAGYKFYVGEMTTPYGPKYMYGFIYKDFGRIDFITNAELLWKGIDGFDRNVAIILSE